VNLWKARSKAVLSRVSETNLPLGVILCETLKNSFSQEKQKKQIVSEP
jgi:hypothetical protein